MDVDLATFEGDHQAGRVLKRAHNDAIEPRQALEEETVKAVKDDVLTLFELDQFERA